MSVKSIINVVELSQGTIENITSFIVKESDSESQIVSMAERFFIETVYNNFSKSEIDMEEEEILSDGYFLKNEKEVNIIWSHNIKSK